MISHKKNQEKIQYMIMFKVYNYTYSHTQIYNKVSTSIKYCL